MKTLLAFLLALTTALHAQELAPELGRLVAKYTADTAALEAQKADALGRVALAYGAALDAAERGETSAGRVAGVAAISHERGELRNGDLKSAFPADLPKGLRSARKTYLDGSARIVADIGQRQERMVADYLRALSALQTRAGSNPVLAQQIAAEKERLLAISDGRAKAALVATKWNWSQLGTGNTLLVAFNPDGTASHGSHPVRWKLSGPRTVVITRSDGLRAVLTLNRECTAFEGTDFDPKMSVKGVAQGE